MNRSIPMDKLDVFIYGFAHNIFLRTTYNHKYDASLEIPDFGHYMYRLINNIPSWITIPK